MATLGDLLKSLANMDLPSPGPSEPIAATSAYIPGYGEKSPNSEPTPESETRPDLVEDGTDLSHGVKKKLAEYAVKNILEEGPLGGFPSPSKDYDDVGHSRQDTLRKAQVEGANHFDPSFFEDTQTSYASKFDGELKKQIVNKREHPGRATLGRQLKALKSHSSNKSTFGSKLEAQAGDDRVDRFGKLENATFELLKDNKYNPSSQTPFLKSDSSRGDQQLSKGMYSLYSGLFGKSTKADGTVPKGVTVSDLRKAALDLLHRGQSVNIDDAGVQADQMFAGNSPFTGKANGFPAGLILNPHATQAGFGTVEVDRLRIRATRAMQGFTDFEIAGQDDLITVESFKTTFGFGGEEDPDTKQVARNAKTYGTMNSPAEPFNGMAPFGMIMPVIYSIIVLGLLGLGFGTLLSGFGSAQTRFKALTVEDPSSLAFGLNALKGEGDSEGSAEIGEKFMNMFGIPGDGGLQMSSMFNGIMLFYGIDMNPFQPGAAIADLFINLLMGPGYYLTISKKVLADFEQIANALKNFNQMGGVFGFITVFLQSLEALASSFTFRWFVIMNQLGRIDDEGRIFSGARAHGKPVIPLAELHRKRPLLTPASRNTMSRWYPAKKGERPLSPLSLRLHHAALLQGEFLGGGAESGHPQKNVPGPMGVAKYITKEQREFIEEEIDGEYVPFSVQDLRTGEIISLPAFITSINDDFQAEYSQTQGFGRTDPVNIYKSTKRNVSISFKMVAMNPEDHDYLWFVLNKFVSMVYPQRDAGRKRFIKAQNNNVEFIQPFSQVIAASPVIRIRVGDLLASNASASGFRKILGDPSFTKSSAADETTAEELGALKRGTSALRTLSTYYSNETEDDFQNLFWGSDFGGAFDVYVREGCPAYVKLDDRYFQFQLKYGIFLEKGDTIEVGEGDGKEFHYKYKVDKYVTDEIDAMALGGNPMLTAYRKANAFTLPPPPFGDKPDVSIIIPSKPAQGYVTEAAGLSHDLNLTLDAIQKDEFPVDKIVEKLATRFDPAAEEEEAMKPVVEEFKNEQKALLEGLIEDVRNAGGLKDALEEATVIETFMSPSGNPIIRSFDRAAGRGLAGVITTLNLNYDQTIWGVSTDSPTGRSTGRRAPKYVTVTMNFQPMHDLPLGLNHEGEMLAPSHPVGRLSKVKLDQKLEGNLLNQETVEGDRQKARRAVGGLPATDSPGALKLGF